MKLSKLNAFYKLHANIYDFTRPFFLLDREKAIDELQIKPSDVICDFGCGTGLNLPHLIAKGATEIVGVDYSEPMLKKARSKFPDITFIQANIEDYKLPEKADKIICTYALSMVENWEKTVQNFRKNLKPDGKVVILDFHPWNGLMTAWLKMHGVNPNQNVEKILKQHFKQVDKKLFHGGYNYLLQANLPVQSTP